jgi:hypothetical protein
MTKDEIVEQAADKYESEGYHVTKAAGKGAVPIEIDHLRERIDLIAEKDGEYVVVEVKRRDQLHEISPLEMTVKRNLPGFRYDLVVYPPGGVDDIPLEDGEPNAEYVESLFDEAQRLVDLDKPRAAFLIAWSAVESAMRESIRRERLEMRDGAPSFVMQTLYSNGVISFEDYDRLRQCLEARNRLVHGLVVNRLEPDDVRFMIEFARQLQCAFRVSSDV